MNPKYSLLFFFIFFAVQSYAQPKSEVQQMQEKAFEHLNRKDYDNSVMILTQAIRIEPDNVSLRRDLAYSYFLAGKLDKAKETITPVVQSEVADEQTFQIAAAIEDALGKYRNARRHLQNGLKKFPQSGLLHHNLGNLYSANKSDKAALAAWKDGIAVDPGYSQNYFSTANMLYGDGNYVWAIIYSEVFLSLDPYSPRIETAKKTLIDAYRSLFSDNGSSENSLPIFRVGNNNEQDVLTFEKCFRDLLLDHAIIIKDGLDAESLTKLRTRFIMDWKIKHEKQFPFSLFYRHYAMIKSGYFSAYNQWLFGPVSNIAGFNLWKQNFGENYQGFEQWMNKNPLQVRLNDPRMN